MEVISIIIFFVIGFFIWYCCGGSSSKSASSSSPSSENKLYPDLSKMKSNSLFSMFGGSNYSSFVDRFTSLEDVTAAVRKAGLESCGLIFGIDYTTSNSVQGQRTFGGQSLHSIGKMFLNPYQQVICILGETLESFDDDGKIPAFGFGDASTRDKAVFPFRAEGFCYGFHDVLEMYNQITPNIRLSGGTNFAPLIYKAIEIVKHERSYHILVIVADGQVTNERDTINAIVEASSWPLSIVMVGVGDGPWDIMEDFDDRLPRRKFDNFQFVDFHKIMTTSRNPQAAFALHALMEIPDQFKTIKDRGMLNFYELRERKEQYTSTEKQGPPQNETAIKQEVTEKGMVADPESGEVARKQQAPDRRKFLNASKDDGDDDDEDDSLFGPRKLFFIGVDYFKGDEKSSNCHKGSPYKKEENAMDELRSFLSEHQTAIASLIVTGVTLYLFRLWAAGGKCYSKARLDGKTVIITGCNTGIGKETAIDLAGRGARVIMACRDRGRGETALAAVIERTGNKQVVLKILDLASLDSVRKFAEDINKTEPRLDILINNAGVMICPYLKTAEGFEMQFGTNHLGHFLLTNLLLDKIKKSAPARIVNVSSLAHIFTDKINFDDINSEKSYNRTQAYAQSKLANILFSRELSRRLKGTGVTVNSLHPGSVITELQRYVPGYKIIWPLIALIFKTPREGAQTNIYCAVDESLDNVTGKYFSDCAVKEESKAAQDDEAARRLWEVSAQMVNLDK
ncbi:uncharacterized protein LOC133201230 [Saccostrea echinata]|uniref:uncharacterized protein LOC133201230 n=1 Tax=Saccostrea echinata TaxID=191078 RepID=UPI002A81CEEF|nr:uncharacterized protein LOC133201230 [Saccostrea echinata]